MTDSPRIHIQFSGSLQPYDALSIYALLKEAIDRRPDNCGAVLRMRELGSSDPDIAMQDANGIVLPIDEIINSIEDS